VSNTELPAVVDHAIGRIPKKGQEGFHRAPPSRIYVVDHDEASGVARTLVRLGGRTYLVKVDGDEWDKDGE
jgi:hypothetical protein